MNQNLPAVTTPSSNYAPPLVTRERFAELVFGSKDAVGVVVGMINKGYLPTVSIGKYSFVNLALLQRECLEKEFSL